MLTMQAGAYWRTQTALRQKPKSSFVDFLVSKKWFYFLCMFSVLVWLKPHCVDICGLYCQALKLYMKYTLQAKHLRHANVYQLNAPEDRHHDQTRIEHMHCIPNLLMSTLCKPWLNHWSSQYRCQLLSCRPTHGRPLFFRCKPPRTAHAPKELIVARQKSRKAAISVGSGGVLEWVLTEGADLQSRIH